MLTKLKNLSIPRELITSGGIVVFGTFFGAIANYLFQRSMATLLPSQQYGELVALLNLLVLFTVPAAIIQLVANRQASELLSHHGLAGIRQLSLWLMKKMLPVALILTVISVLLSPAIANYLHFDNLGPILALSPIVFLGLLLPVIRGALQGGQKFWAFAWSTTSEGLIRFLAGLALALLGYHLYGAIGGVIIGMLASLVFSLIPLHLHSGEKTDVTLHIPLHDYLVVTIALFTTSFYFAADVLLVKHYFSNNVAAQYAAVSTVAKYLFHFSSPIISVMFPLITAGRIKGQRSLPLLGATTALLGLAGLFVLAIFALFPTRVLGLLFPGYTSQAALLPLVGLFVLLYELLYLLVQYFLAMRDEGFAPWLLAGGVLFVLFAALFHRSLAVTIEGFIASAAISCLLLIIYGLFHFRQRARAA